MSNALYAILAMALVTSVGAGVAIHAMDSESPEHLVTVEGTLDDGHEIEAFTVWINGGNAIVLRTGEMPPWAQERSGHTGEDNDNENETEDSGSD